MAKKGKGRFYNPCQFNYEALNKTVPDIIIPLYPPLIKGDLRGIRG
ncbi:MAG: hypothetical protein AABY58_05380 [Nitrospirota bacterium]